MRSVAFAVAVVMSALTALPAAAERAQPAPAGRAGALEVTSTTTGADVSIDGERVGTIPLPGPLTTLPPGEHTIKVEKPGFAPYIDVFKIDRKKPTRVEVELVAVAGVLRVKASVEA